MRAHCRAFAFRIWARRLPRVKILLGKVVCAVAVFVAALCLTLSRGHAGLYGDSRWCAVTDQGGGVLNWDCEYDTIENCTPAVIQGNRGYCALNPYWSATADGH
jgi:hypothetical protein